MFRGLLTGPALACALLATPAAAALQLDQSNVPESGLVPFSAAGTSLSAGYVLGQTFTAGMSGQLMRIDLAVLTSPYVSYPGGFTVSVEKAPGVALASGHVDIATLPKVFSADWSDLPQIDFSGAGVFLTANDLYRIVLKVDPGTDAGFTGWFYDYGGLSLAYGGGNAIAFTPYGEFALGIDYGFRTYMAAGGVPEPASWALLILGFGGTGAALRRKSHARAA